MAQEDYIPDGYAEFFPWQNNLVTMVSTNAVAWGIPVPKVTELGDKQDIYVPLYTAATTPSTKTKAANVAHEEGRKVYEKYIRGFVKEFLINNSAISTQEKIDTGLNPNISSGGSRPAIETSPHTTLKGLGGGVMKFECRVESDSSRASRHTDSDGVEIRYRILEKEGVGSPPPGEPGGGDMPTPETCPLQYFSTKATFKLELGGSNVGKLIFVFTRWKNNTSPEKSGPYQSLPVIALIS
ncbi:MAG: hypothetical protein V4615_11905 [Bacteroidota bacterium]